MIDKELFSLGETKFERGATMMPGLSILAFFLAVMVISYSNGGGLSDVDGVFITAFLLVSIAVFAAIFGFILSIKACRESKGNTVMKTFVLIVNCILVIPSSIFWLIMILSVFENFLK